MYSDLVEQKTTTTGTVAYVVSSTVPGRRTFTSAFVNGDAYIPYVVTDDMGGYECGLGTWTTGTLSLARTVVMASSNAGAAVNWAAGTRRIYVTSHAAVVGLLQMKHNVNGSSTAPTVSNDSTQGYGPGSLWLVNTPALAKNRLLYICISAATGAAVWQQVVTENRTFTVASNYFFNGLLRQDGTNANYGNCGLTFKAGATFPGANFTIHDGAVTGLMAQTANATVTKMGSGGVHATYYGVYLEGKSVTRITGSVTAMDDATGDARTWNVSATLKCNASDVVTIASSSVTLDYSGDASLAALVLAWANSNNDITFDVTGIAATNITWTAALLVAQSAYY